MTASCSGRGASSLCLASLVIIAVSRIVVLTISFIMRPSLYDAALQRSIAFLWRLHVYVRDGDRHSVSRISALNPLECTEAIIVLHQVV